MKTKLFITTLFALLTIYSNAQNISINSTGASNSTSSMLEVLQPGTANNTKSLFVRHSGNVAGGTGYGLWSEVTGTSTTNIAGYFSSANATNKYAIIVPSGGGNVGIGTSAPGYILHTVGTSASTSTIYSSASSASSNGINGENTAASGTTAGGYGVYGVTIQGTSAASLGGAGVAGFNSHTNGIGIVGVGNNLGTFVQPNPTATGCGGAFYGRRYGLFSNISNTTSAGSGFDDGQTYSAIVAKSSTTAANTSLYNFAIQAFSDCSASGGRVAAVLGIRGSGDWGANGYFSSGGVSYGLFYSTGGGTGGFKMANGAAAKASYNIGIGGCGDLMGSWTKGNIYGMMVKGKRYSLYVDGTTYTNSVIAQLSDNGTEAARTVSYVPTSTSVDVYTRGIATLSRGKAFVKFNDNYKNMISPEFPVMVTVTPMGETKGVYILSVCETGFTVAENAGGTSNVRFSWIAVGTKKGCNKIETPAELLAPDYDANMNDVMFNENIKEKNAKSIWWDGEKLRFDKPLRDKPQ